MLGEALEILTDDMRRKLYDEGHDKEAIEVVNVRLIASTKLEIKIIFFIIPPPFPKIISSLFL